MPAFPPHVLERMRWSTLNRKAKRRLLAAVPSRAYYRVFRPVRQEIVIRASKLGIPDRRLREHLEMLLEQGVLKAHLGERVLQDLQELEELKQATGVEDEHFREVLQHQSIAASLHEMKQHAQAMGQLQQQ